MNDAGVIDADWAFSRYEAVRARLPQMPEGPAASERASGLGALAERFDAFLLDGFGVLNVGGRAVPGAPEQMALLRRAGCRLLVLTNAATEPPAASVAKYARLGFDFTLEEIVSSRMVMAAALAEWPADMLWGIAAAGPASMDGIAPRTVALADQPGDYDAADGIILLSGDQWDERHQERLCESLTRRARPVLVANPDIVAPRESGLTREPGEWAHRLADEVGVTPEFFGKPFANAYRIALARLGDAAPSRIAMVGDTLHTDILGGAAAGVRTVLVEAHGLFAGRDVTPYIEASGIVPDVIVPTT